MHLLDGDNPALDEVTQAASQRHTSTAAIKLFAVDGSACIVGCDDTANRWLRTILITLTQHFVKDTLWQSLYTILLGFRLQPVLVGLYVFTLCHIIVSMQYNQTFHHF